MREYIQKVRSSIAGTAAVEFGIIIPMLLIVLAGMVEVGFAVRQAMLAQDAAETGAGYAVKYGFNATTISSAVVNATSATDITASPAPFQFCGCPTSTGVTSVSCSTTCSDGSSPGQYVTVSAAVPHASILTYLGLPIPATMTAHATVRLQ